MNHRRKLREQTRSLEEMHKILGSMKNLAYIESRKLTDQLENQALNVEDIAQAAADFLAFHPNPFTNPAQSHVLLAIGSERGFCGDFNDQLLRCLHEATADPKSDYTALISVGYRLGAKLESHPLLAAAIEGADTTEEIDTVLVRILDTLDALRDGGSPARLSCLRVGLLASASTIEVLLPPFQDLRARETRYASPPMLYLPPQDFFLQLVDQYLFAVLHKHLYESFMAENQQRLQHLDGALHHLDDRLNRLKLKDRQLRQEEIIEEIEVIMLGSGGDEGLGKYVQDT